MNRGSEAAVFRRARRYGRFNEAPIHESGKCDPRPSARAISPGFNEAPIHESGKCWRLRSSRPRACCFNEAPIHESGK